jgi:shikimate 5-dehydrogenase
MYFIGGSTGRSSIMQVFPIWARELGINGVLKGIDLPLHAPPDQYRQVVDFIKGDPMSLGALVTTHKLDLYKAARDLFDGVGESTEILDEVSSISKRGTALWGHAMDSVTSGLALEAIVGDGYWSSTGADLLIIGAGGSSLALTLYLHERAVNGRETPARVVVTNRSPERLDEMQSVHRRIGFKVPIDYHLAPTPIDNDNRLRELGPGSVVINATGLGKDRPGSPLTDDAIFPEHGIAWEFNYRGDLVFLDQARAQATQRHLRVEDGWFYFLHGWTRVIDEVFHRAIPTEGPVFDRLSELAIAATRARPTVPDPVHG